MDLRLTNGDLGGMGLERKPYPSDVTDEEWVLVAPYLILLPEEAGQREPSFEVFNGLRHIVKTGAPWRWMPNDLPPWAAVYQQAQRWLVAGCHNGDRMRVAFLDCRDRETMSFVAATGGLAGEHVQGRILAAVEHRYSSCYVARNTRRFARDIGLEPRTTLFESPESNGMAEAFIRTLKQTTSGSMPSQTPRLS